MIGTRGIRMIIVLVAIALILAGGVLLVRLKKKALAAAPRYGMQPVPVRVATARQGNLEQTRDYLSVVEPIRVANVSARITASVEKVLYDENDPVKAGDILVVLDGRQIEESVAAAKAQVEQARADLASNAATVASLEKTCAYWKREARRDRTLADDGAIPGAQAESTADKANEAQGKLDAARQKSAAIGRQIEALQRKLAELKTTLGYCTIRSPFDGLVSNHRVDPGDLATPGKSLMVIEDRSRLKLSFDVPQQDLAPIHEGVPVTFSISGKTRTASLSHLFPTLSAARMLRAEVYLSGADNTGLLSGTYVPLHVVVKSLKDVTLVPSSSVIESPNARPYVFIVIDHHLHAMPVSILGAEDHEVAVKGVKSGDLVVLSTFLGWAQLSAGLEVEAMK